MLGASLTLSVVEIILLLFGAIILGVTIHFFIASNKSLKARASELEKPNLAHDEWKLRYFNDMEMREKEMAAIRERLEEAEENVKIFSMEAKELHRQKRLLEAELAEMQKAVVTPVEKERSGEHDYIEQLRLAQTSLVEQNQKINQLLGHIDVIKGREETQREMQRSNEELSAQLNNLRAQLAEKDKEINHIRQKEQLTSEMKSMLDNTYQEFNTLQGKIHKLEAQLNASKLMNMEYEDLKEAHSRMSRDFEEQRLKLNALTIENQQLQNQLAAVEDNLREANFQRQQLQKRTLYLEELNRDLQVVSDTNKKLENQLRKVGELESMLNVVSEERDQLMRNRGL